MEFCWNFRMSLFPRPVDLEIRLRNQNYRLALSHARGDFLSSRLLAIGLTYPTGLPWDGYKQEIMLWRNRPSRSHRRIHSNNPWAGGQK